MIARGEPLARIIPDLNDVLVVLDYVGMGHARRAFYYADERLEAFIEDDALEPCWARQFQFNLRVIVRNEVLPLQSVGQSLPDRPASGVGDLLPSDTKIELVRVKTTLF